MFKRILMSSIFIFFACDLPLGDDDDSGTGTIENLSLTYVAGHLGNYYDCPTEGTPVTSAAHDASDAGASKNSDSVAGDCAEDTNCGGSMNCETASISLQIENTGADAIQSIHVTDLALLDDEANTITQMDTLKILNEDGSEFTGSLASGASQVIRIEYRGPSYSEFNNQNKGKVRITLESADNQTESITTELIETLGVIVT
jgi:hypothetical protein